MSNDDDFGDSGPGFDDNEFSYDGENFGEEDLEKGGGSINKEGMYHFDVTDVTSELDTVDTNGRPKAASILFPLAVLHTVPGQSPAGMKLFHRIQMRSKDGAPPHEAMQKAALRFGVALGLLETKDVGGRSVTVIKGTDQTRIPASFWLQAKGKQVIGKVQFEKGDPAKGYKDKYAVSFGNFWHPTDPEVAGVVPMNLEALQTIGIKVAPAGTKAATPPATNGATQQKAKPAPAPVVDDLGDL